MTVLLNRVTGRRVQIEVSPDKGDVGTRAYSGTLTARVWVAHPGPPRQSVDALPDRSENPCLHRPPRPTQPVNDRARDVEDLMVLRTLTEMNGHPSLTEMRAAVEDIFAASAAAEITDAVVSTTLFNARHVSAAYSVVAVRNTTV